MSLADEEQPLSSTGLSILNPRPRRLPGPSFLHQLIRPASNDGVSAAIDFLSKDGQRIILSYSELHRLSCTLAYTISSCLRLAATDKASTSEARVSPIVPILCPQSPQLYVAILAVLKAGGAFCPLDPGAPPDRIRFILDDVATQVVLVSRELASKLPTDNKNRKVIFIDDILDTPKCDDYQVQGENVLKPEDIAYVMYTSGSTGEPKGIAISHLAATQSILAHQRHIPPFSRFLQFAASIFDVSVFEVFFPLFRGATLVGCDRAELLINLVGVLKKMDVDACELTPSVAGSLLRHRARAPGLRLLLTIGELLTEPVVQEFGGDDDRTSILWGMYGPTEATIHCTVQVAFEASADRRTIGIPLDTVSVFVVRIQADCDTAPTFEILPLGEVGELALGGLQLATSYLNQPEKMAAQFMDTPWGRVYRTGDKARIRRGGTIEYQGRINDGQVKLNGQRVELGEVEQALLRTPGCHSAVAAVISNRLIAFAAVEQMSDPSTQLWTQCRSWLPSSMMPADIVVMEQLPKMPSGKADRKRLISDYMNTATETTPNKAIDPHEGLLCEVISAILGEPISPQTKFSTSNLDSLAAIELASALRERGISITPIDILSAKTPRELRQRMENNEAMAIATGLEHLSVRHIPFDDKKTKESLGRSLGDKCHEIDHIGFSTPLQKAMITETLKNSSSYINRVGLDLHSTLPHLTVDSIRSAFQTLAERNDILRTGFTFVENQLCQVIWKQLDDSQIDIRYSCTENPPDEILDAGQIESFLLRPLRITIIQDLAEKRCTLHLTLHHAIYDGWTMDLIIEDLSILLRGGVPIERPQFSQITSYLQDQAVVESIDSMEFWAEHLRGAGAVATPSLKTETVPKPRQTVIKKTISLHSEDLQRLSAKGSVGPQVIFQACVAWLWSAVQGTGDTIIGCVSSGRSLPLAGIDKLMGPCITTLPLRIDFSRYRTIIELLQDIHSINRETLQHGTIPLSRIHHAVGLAPNTKLFDVIFAYQESPASRRRNSSIVQESWHRDATEAKLLIEIQPSEENFICQLTFQNDIIPEDLGHVLADHLDCLISYFNGHFDAPIETIFECFPFHAASKYNVSPTSEEIFSSLPEMVEYSASQFSPAPALHFTSSTDPSAANSPPFSYRDLNAKANQIARHLQQYRVVPGGIVAVIMEKSPLLYFSILGVLKTGCAYLPILPSTPFERVNVILNQAEPCLCITDTSSLPLVTSRESPAVINIEAAVLSPYSTANLGVNACPSDLAYVIYTSGTTGTPKGVSVTNRNILSNIKTLSSIYPHGPSDRMLQACSQAFDVSVFEIFFTWANGMCLCAATNDTLFEDFEGAVRSFEITHLSLTVTVAAMLNPENVPTVKFLVTSGEPMTDDVLDTWSKYLYQGYGPSETTNICTVRKVSRGDASHFLGRSFNNTSTFILYPNSMHPVPLGCIGELCFGGDQVASGYLKLPEATAAKFIDHPDYGRVYRSGDLGRMFRHGFINIHGRTDTQVKIRGLRVELQEIQAVSLNSGLTRACRSVLITHKSQQPKAIALFYVPFDHNAGKYELLPPTEIYKSQVQALKHELQARLPDYMVPTVVLPISKIPVTSSGKIDEGTLRRSASELPADVLAAYDSTTTQADTDLGMSDTETLIVNIVADLLGHERREISRWSTFSAMGIDSISAMSVAQKLQTALSKRVALSLILQNPSISRLAVALDDLEHTVDSISTHDNLLPEDLVEVMRKRYTHDGLSVAKVLPCTPLQEAMVMSSLNRRPTITDDLIVYHNQMLLRLRIPYEAIIGHWNEVIQRHEILRAVFVTTNNINYPVIQVILNGYVPQWEVLDVEDDLLFERASQHIASASATPICDRPPIALAVIRTKQSGNYVSFVCHHSMYDGISMQIMLSEIEILYHGSMLPKAPSMEPFIRETKSLRRHKDDFWKQLFLGFESNPLKCIDFTQDTMPRTFSTNAPHMSLNAIEFELRNTGVSMLALIHTAWAITLSAISGRSDISFGSVVAGRSTSLNTASNLVAPCFNTLPVRMNLAQFKFFIDIMRGFQALNAQMITYQFSNLRHIQKELVSSNPLFDTLVILQPPATPLDDRVWSLEYEDGIMDIPLVCEVIPSQAQDTLTIRLYRDRSKFSYQAMQLVVDIFLYTIGAILRHPSSHLITDEQLPDDMRIHVTRLFCRTEIAEALKRFPDPILDHEEENWSPSELTVRQTLAKLTRISEDQVRRLTPIYRYGIDSIAAIQLALLLRDENVFVSVTDMLQSPTCAGIAAAVVEHPLEDPSEVYDFESFRRQAEKELRNSEIDLEPLEAILPCTAIQQGLLSQFLHSKGQHYFNYSSWVLESTTRVGAVGFALEKLADQHEILRTGFVPVDHPDSSFAMLVYSASKFAAPVIISQSESFDAKHWLSTVTANELANLGQPPWRVVLETSEKSAFVTIHLAIHHAIYDAFTLRRLLSDLIELISHKSPPKPPSVRDAVSHYFGLVESNQSAGQKFWRQKADGFVFHKFPVMTPLHVENNQSLMVSRACEISSSSIRQAASRASITVQAALQAAWVRILSAYTGEAQVTFGVVLDGRTTEFAQRATIPMITTLPVIAENVTSNSELTQQMMQYNSELRRAQFVPMAQIQRFLGTPGSKLFDTILTYQAADTATQLPQLRAVQEIATVEYGLSLEVEELPSDMTKLNLAFRSDLLPQKQALLLLDQFEAILMDLLSLIESPNTILTVSRHDLFSILPSNCESLPIGASLLHELVESSAQASPTAAALEFVDDITLCDNSCTWTYEELDARGNQVAHFIMGCGIEPGSIIATCFNKSPMAYFTLLGILKAGCAFLCLDPSAPALRQTFILGDSHAVMLIVCDQFDWAHDASLPVHFLHEGILQPYPTSRPSLRRHVLPSDTCYCLYTSGTTGTPKGCLISHENSVQAMAAFENLFAGRWDQTSRWLQFAAFHFDVSILEQYWSWYVGITVVAAPKDVILSDLAGTISKLGITHIDLTPSLARLISPDECPSLCNGVFITGGEKLRSEVLDTWGPKGVIHNAYGPTEATIGVTMYRGVPQNGRASNIGNLFPNVGAYVFEKGTETPVLRGAVGELCVFGKLVGKGYLNNETLNKERFPVLRTFGERIYRTGDLVRVLSDDSIDFIGRADDQVKLRGQRLEIGEINHAIQEGLPNKSADVATMVVRRGAQNIDLLVSFIAPSSSFEPASELEIYYDASHKGTVRAALEACRAHLATYMVPSFIVCLSRIPLTTNNKVDANRLRTLFLGLGHEQLQVISLSSLPGDRDLNGVERKILETIYQITHAQEDRDVSPATTTFELGIDSISAAGLARQLRKIGIISASTSVILRHPQLRQLSEALSQGHSSSPRDKIIQLKQSITAIRHRYLGFACETLGVGPTDVEYIAPCTPLQQGMIARSKNSHCELAYFNQFHLCLASDTSVSRFKAAFGKVITSYSVLRTAFVDTPDGSLQVAIRNRPMRWFEVDAKVGSLEQTIAERRRLWVDANRSILKWPVEVDHIEDGKQHHILLRLFHGVYDARSLTIVLDNLVREYHGISWPHGPSFVSVLPEGPLLNPNESHDFWKSHLQNHQFQPMPSLINSSVAEANLVHRSMKLEGFQERRKELQVTHQTLLQVAWLHTLSPYFSGTPTIGVIFSGRSLPIDDIDLVVGPLFNTLPLRADFTNETSLTSLARKVQQLNNEFLTFVHTPLRDIQKLCTNGQPIFDTLFTFDRDYEISSNEKHKLFSIQETPSQSDYPLAIEIMMAKDETLHITLVAQGTIADVQALDSLLDGFFNSMQSIIMPNHDAYPSPQAQKLYPQVSQQASIAVSESSSFKDFNIAIADSSFTWDTNSFNVRNEVADLSGVNRDDISEATNLFALGLDSIDMIKLSGRLSRLGYNVSVGMLMKQQTLKSIAVGLKKSAPRPAGQSSTAELDATVSILEDWYHESRFKFPDIEAILPPTPLQDSMVAEMLQSDCHRYFNHDVLELPHDIDINRLKVALSTVYESSPILRTGFIEVDDPRVKSAYCQIVRKHALELPSVLRISTLDEISTLTDLATLRASESEGASQLFQVKFAELDSRKFLVLSIAHALYDGWSLQMLLKDIEAAYKLSYTPRTPYEPHLSRVLLQSNNSQKRFWSDLLQETHGTCIPKLGMEARLGIIRRLELQSKASSLDIRTLCKRHRITPQVLGQVCWAAVLASLSHSLDVVFGIVLSGRDTEEAQALMFPTMNTVALRLTLHGTVTEFLDYSRDIVSGVIEAQHTPLREIQRQSQTQGGLLFNTIFILQNSGNDNFGNYSFLKSVHSVSALDYPICAELELAENGPIWRIAVDEGYLPTQIIDNILPSLERILEYFSGDRDTPVLVFDSDRPQTVAICGLPPVEFQTESEGGGDASTREPVPQPVIPSSHDYETLLAVLSELCGIEQHEINLNSSVFHIGLDSISAIKASAMLRKRGLDISTRDLVATPSICDILTQAQIKVHEDAKPLSRGLGRLNSAVGQKEVSALIREFGSPSESVDVQTVLPALPMQVHMLSVWRNSGGATFFSRFTFEITGLVDLATASKAWVALVNETEMLRTYFLSTSSSRHPFIQAILKSEFANKQAKTATNKSDGRWEYFHAATPFAVAHFICERPGKAKLNFYVHHALYDSVSLPIILDRFAELCNTTTAPLENVWGSYWYDFALKHVDSRIQAESESFWTYYLRDTTFPRVSQIPQRHFQNTKGQTNEFRRTNIKNTAKLLRLRGSAHGVSTQALLLAAYAKSFMKWLRQDGRLPVADDEDADYIFGTYMANRSAYPNLDNAPFPTLNILPLRVRSPLKRDVVAMAIEIQRDLLDIGRFQNSTASLWEIQKWTSLQKEGEREKEEKGGIVINTFVNILAHPADNSPSSPKPNSIALERTSDGEIPPLSGDISTYLIAPDSRSLSSASWSDTLSQSYPEALDIEMGLQGDELALGVFGPSSIVSAAEAKAVSATILAELEAL